MHERLVLFTVLILKVCDKLHNKRISYYLSDQISRASLSSALNYGESRAAESKKDYIHKFKLVLKELFEVNTGLQIIKHSEMSRDNKLLESAINENRELISIFVKSIQTMKSSNKNGNQD